MLFLTTVFLALGVLGVRALPFRSDPLANVTAAFTEAGVVPDVISSFNPHLGLDILFKDPVTNEDAHVVPGILLTTNREFISCFSDELTRFRGEPLETDQPPRWFLSFNQTDLPTDVSWVITIVDPDALTPQDPSVAQFLHFIGNDFVVDSAASGVNDDCLEGPTGLRNNSAALVEFFHPSPPAGSDPHRYVVLAYVQPDDFAETGLAYFNGTIPPGTDFREHFNITDFAVKTDLGEPIAGNFFLVGPAANA
ncbi:Protein D1 [Leucoagaricus sp. SymC.cos]|nr:Protein D1 [Leucoagaricus sp. SymC.cos]